MTRRRLWLASGLVTVVAVVGVVLGVLLPGGRSPSDCDAVRALVDESGSFHDAVARDVNGGAVAAATDYDEQVARLMEKAGEIGDAELARRAREVGDLAGRMVALVSRPRGPEFAGEFSRTGAPFNANLTALSQACPDPGDRIRISG